MRTAVLTETETLELEDRARPTPDPDEVLVSCKNSESLRPTARRC